MSENLQSIESFLNDLEQSNPDQFSTINALHKIVISLGSIIQYKIMYGGIYYSTEVGLGGIFPYISHSSFEFSNGILLDDPKKQLKGQGKYRRHITYNTFQDIDEEYLVNLINQAISL